jgi:hypothetical protein
MQHIVDVRGRQRCRVAVLVLAPEHGVPDFDARDIRLLEISFLKK